MKTGQDTIADGGTYLVWFTFWETFFVSQTLSLSFEMTSYCIVVSRVSPYMLLYITIYATLLTLQYNIQTMQHLNIYVGLITVYKKIIVSNTFTGCIYIYTYIVSECIK